MISTFAADREASQVAVIGAGPGGLAAAVILAASGASVDVYEALPAVGGRSRRLTLESGRGAFHFDAGPTFFMMPYVLEEILAAAGRRLTDHVHLARLDPMYRLLLGRPGRPPIQLDTTQDLDAMARRIAAIEPADGPAFLRFMNDNRRKLAAMTPLLRRPLRGVIDLLSSEARRAGVRLRPWQSLHRHLSGYFSHDQIRLALSFQSKYLGMSPFDCPELFSILPFIEYEYGIWHPRGGCNALMTAMRDIAADLGARFHLGARVDAVEFEGRRAVGVRVGGALRRHRHVVINADAAAAMKRLIPEPLRGSWSDAAIDRKKYSCSTAMLYLGIDGAVDLPHHTIHTSADYRRNLQDIAVDGVLSEDPSMYVCHPARSDPTMAPAGAAALYVLVPTPNLQPGLNRVDWAASGGAWRERTLDQLERVFGVERLRKRILVEQRTTPPDWAAQGIHFGATFNLAHTLGQMLHRRPQHRMPGVDGAWFVGGGTHPGSGLPVIFLSSQITARLLCDELGLRCALDGAARASPAQGDAMLREWSEPTASI